jgi:hypothetical protein
MNKKLIILTIPGIGTKETGYSSGLEDSILKYTKGTPLENNFRLLESKPFGVTEVDENQRALFERLDAANKLGGMLSLRRFVMEAFGDGVTFERGAMYQNSPYRKIHHYLKEKFEEVNELANEFDRCKIIIVAASLGVHLLSTYIWDADMSKGIFEGQPANPKNNLKNLAYLASIGCNIPLFVSGMPEQKIVAFERRNPQFTWDNYYDQDDVLGWPLKQLSNSYNNLVTDYEINSGAYIGAHVKYWEEKKFTKPFSEKIITLFNQMN